MDEKVVHDDLYKLRHSLAHVMAQAVLELRPKSRLAFGPPIENGCYYDFDLDSPLSIDDFDDITKRMRRIINERQPFEQLFRTASEAVAVLNERGEAYKVEYCEELIGQGETEIGFYRNGPFEDMCRGPHVEHTGKIPPDAFAIDSLAGAYWRGDEKRPQLTRIYVLCFKSRAELDEFKRLRQLALERDHRKLGTELELFRISERIGPGLPLWLPNGTVIKDELEKYARETEFLAGFQRVTTPVITKENLFITSGHLEHYKEGMYPPMRFEGEEQAYYLKPMNCPFHHEVFASRPRSYRELPLRLAEYGTCHRFEDSGSLSGLLRVRSMCMNDAHIYCTPEQIGDEMRSVITMLDSYVKKLRIAGYKFRLSTHDATKTEKFVDNPEAWKTTEAQVEAILEEVGVPYILGKGEAAFYGPKIDVQLRNVVGREETVSTIQLDFAQPERFGLRYIGADGKEHMPYVVHRAPLSTHERMIAFLIELYGGAFPTWLSPVQVCIIPVGEKFNDYAQKLRADLHSAFCRVEVDDSAESFNKRIRNNVTRKIPNFLIVGAKEVESESVTWRRYVTPEQRTVPFAEFRTIFGKLVAERVMDNFADEVMPTA